MGVPRTVGTNLAARLICSLAIHPLLIAHFLFVVFTFHFVLWLVVCIRFCFVPWQRCRVEEHLPHTPAVAPTRAAFCGWSAPNAGPLAKCVVVGPKLVHGTRALGALGHHKKRIDCKTRPQLFPRTFAGRWIVRVYWCVSQPSVIGRIVVDLADIVNIGLTNSHLLAYSKGWCQCPSRPRWPHLIIHNHHNLTLRCGPAVAALAVWNLEFDVQ